MTSRLNALHERHGILDSKIDFEQRRPSADSLNIKSLKKTRLMLRDQIVAIERSLSGS
ncbi:MAG: YdcH family protein [Hyphomicrobiales bacterium]